ncbi:hypothetical protein D3C73_1159890 [compost metagenome]
MGSYSARERELLEQLLQSRDILCNLRIDFSVTAIQIRVGDHNLAAVARAFNIEHVQIIFSDYAVKMGINEVLAGNRSPVSNRFNLHIGILQWFS